MPSRKCQNVNGATLADLIETLYTWLYILFIVCSTHDNKYDFTEYSFRRQTSSLEMGELRLHCVHFPQKYLKWQCILNMSEKHE